MSTAAPRPIDSLETPALLLDREILERNTRAMSERMKALGVALRPHVKTAKCVEVAGLCTGGHSGAITVSTLHEAEYFLTQGYRDIFYAVGIVPAKFGRVADLLARGANITAVTDAPTVARALAEWSVGRSARVCVLIEIDSGGGRAGVLPGSDTLIEIGRALESAGLLAGVMTHAGHSYHAPDVAAVRAIARAERDAVVHAAERLRAVGLPCPVVSVGSTPTAVHATDLSGVTEMRPGVYVFNDLSQLAIGSCRREDLALSVLASVIGHSRPAGHLLIDAGALALSKDAGLAERRPEAGYGEVCDPRTLAPYPGLFVTDTHQEHGFVPLPDADFFERLPVGAKVRVLPGHACMTAAAYDRYQVIAGGEVVDEWARINGW